MRRIYLPAFTLLTLFALSVSAFGQDLKDAAARQKVAADKLMAEVDRAIERSYKQEPTSAYASLRLMQSQVADSEDLLPTQRDTLNRRLKSRINAVQDAARNKSSSEPRISPRDPDRKYSKPPADPNGGVSGVAKGWTEPGRRDQQAHADLIKKREVGIQGINMSIEKSAAGITDKEFTFPPYWVALTKARKEMVDQKLTAKEVALLKTLNSVMSVDYDNDKLKAVLSHIQEKTKLTIIVDETSLSDANVSYDDPVSFKVEKATVRTILKKILGDKNLTYIIKEGSIQVMTPKKASEYTVVRTYQVDDLVAPNPQMQMMFGPFMAQAQMLQNAQMLINLIQASIEPNYWQPNGPGSITFFPPTRSLIVRASAEMHYQLNSPGLFGGR
jgi:hypothetical protein